MNHQNIDISVGNVNHQKIGTSVGNVNHQKIGTSVGNVKNTIGIQNGRVNAVQNPIVALKKNVLLLKLDHVSNNA
jgi:hypothetical protein